MGRLTGLLHSSSVDKSNKRGRGRGPSASTVNRTGALISGIGSHLGLTAAASLFRGAATVRNTQVDSLFSLDRVGVLLIHFFFLSPFLCASQLTWEQRTNEFPLVALRRSMERRKAG